MDDRRKSISPRAVIWILAAVLAAEVLGSVVLGRYPIGWAEFWGILASGIAPVEPFWTPTQEALLLHHRLPRIALACMVGGCLAGAGVSYQGVFRNPMAAPDILGASSGAALGAALAIFLDLGGFGTVVFAFGASLLTVGAVIFTGSRIRGKRSLGLILAGIMISSMVSSGTSFLKLVADPEDQLPAITYWMMGSLNGTGPEDLFFAVGPMAAGLGMLLLLRWRMNVLTLSSEESQTIGVNPGKLRNLVVVCATLITAAGVSVSGMIGWVGLVVPHLARKLVGSDYRHLLPASVLFGAVFLLTADNISRNLLPTEIPIGILTSLIGAPLFIFLLTKEETRI